MKNDEYDHLIYAFLKVPKKSLRIEVKIGAWTTPTKRNGGNKVATAKSDTKEINKRPRKDRKNNQSKFASERSFFKRTRFSGQKKNRTEIRLSKLEIA